MAQEALKSGDFLTKAAQLIEHGKPGKIELQDLPNPVAAGDEVVLEVEACGLNHLDLWLEENALPIPIRLPRTPGSEIAGRIIGVGAGVKGWKVGDRVAVQSNLFCGQCEFCLAGRESLCLRGEIVGIQRQGGLAQQVAVPARALVGLPGGVSFETGAALSLAASTAMHMLTYRTTVRPGDWVLVMGASSGVGSAAIQIALALGAKVITTGSSEAKRELGRQLGATAALDSTSSAWPAEVRQITGQRGAAVVVEHLGGEVLQQVFSCLARDGTIVTCGATAGREVVLKLWPFFVKEQKLVGSYGRNRIDLEQTLEWAAEGKLKPVIDSILPLSQTGLAFLKLRERKVMGKILVRPSSAA